VSLFSKFWVKFKSKKIQLQKTSKENQKKKFMSHDEKLVQKLSNNKKVPSFNQIKFISKYLNKTEKTIIRILCGILIISSCALLINLYSTNSEIKPKSGGKYTEGLVGSPQYINPLFAQANDADLDINSLVYSGLLKYTDHGLEKDLSENYEISTDQLTYTFTLRQDLYFHDGEQLNADDVVFTFERILNKQSKTPLYFNFAGSTIEKIDDYSIKFILPTAFAPFLESLTVGILPEHIWNNIQAENMTLAEYNLKPIGSGPYKFKSLLKNKDGVIKSFNLEVNKDFYNTPSYINEITFKFFENFEEAVSALNNKTVEGISFLPKEIRERIINNRNLNFNLLNLPQYTSAFFNWKKNAVLKDPKIRKILSHAINKEKIASDILNAEAQIIHSPILPGSLGYNPDITTYPYNLEHAKAELEKAFWTLEDYTLDDPAEDETSTENEDSQEETLTENEDSRDNEDEQSENQETIEPVTQITNEYPFKVRQLRDTFLEFTLTTVNQNESIQIAKELQKEWQQIGAKVNINAVDPKAIADIIQNRDYEVLLYGQILGMDPDPFPFWHSSQTSFPGLNLTSLNNTTIDKLLNDARKTSNDNDRAAKYGEFQTLLAEEIPAIFLFNPTYTYPQNKKIKGFNTSKIITPSNRFSEISSWFIKTKRSWN
jgi:peptide/nickel transport system substrate-binding protein